jgi:hypothetical protein
MKVGDVELFLHVLGVISVFVGFGTLLMATIALMKSSRVEQVRAIMGPLVAGRRIGFEHISVIDVIVVAGVLLIAGTGAAMARADDYVWSGWVDVATATFLLLAPVGPLVINPRLHALASEAAGQPDGLLPASVRARIDDPVLALAMRCSVAVLVGIVFLMTTKPTSLVSVIVILVALTIGAAVSPITMSVRARFRHCRQHQR